MVEGGSFMVTVPVGVYPVVDFESVVVGVVSVVSIPGVELSPDATHRPGDGLRGRLVMENDARLDLWP